MELEKLRSEFMKVLLSRRSAEVPLSWTIANPVSDPLYQGDFSPTFSQKHVYCPISSTGSGKHEFKEENLYLATEASEQGRLPLLILSPKCNNASKRPAVVFLHSTHKCKEWLRPLLELYASRGYVTIAIDSRYHGERANDTTTYQRALISSWKKGDTLPFIFDTVWDLIKLADYLTQREDVDAVRIGITGESLGGMHAWFAAAVDTRYSVVVPIIGVQGFHWAIDNGRWQSRVDSIRPVFEEARKDLGKNAVDAEVVKKVWDRIAPGLITLFDSPSTIPAIAPRPLLILNGAEDPRCPIEGLQSALENAQKAYKDANCVQNIKFIAETGTGHQMTPEMVKLACEWFDDKLLKGTKGDSFPMHGGCEMK